MKVLLLSAYTAASHRYWIEGMQSNLPEIDWTVLALPPRHFNWRIRGNSLSWAYDSRNLLAKDYDCVLATSMVDLATLRGLVPSLANAYTVVYFHENQFVYPPSLQVNDKQKALIEPQLVNLYTALCADRVVFNSHYNMHTCIDGVASLLKKMPDCVPQGICEHLQERAIVVPVPLDDRLFSWPQNQKTQSTFHLVWNHRWEYDKGPERLYGCLQALPRELDLCVHVVGQQFRQHPKVFQSISRLLQNNNWNGHMGFMSERQAYLELLAKGDGVLSTALHDFQGLSVLEACALGCLPLVPDRLAYREFIPDHFRYPSNLEVPDCEAKHAAQLIESCMKSRELVDANRAPLDHLSWSHLLESYRQVLSPK